MKLNIIFVLLVVSLFIFGCTQDVENKESTTVKLQLKWVHQAQFAGNYVAKEKGFYFDNRLNVEMLPFDFEKTFPIPGVQNKEFEFAITGADELILAKAAGTADNIKAIAVIYQENPVTLYSLKESGIDSPDDFIGKTIGIERAGDGTEINVGILYIAMMDKVGVDRSQVNEITIGYDATELLAGETDVSSGYIINEPNQAIEAGYEINIIKPSDYDVDMYADVVIVHEDTINENPELIQSFLDATIKGWEFALEEENKQETIDIVLKYATDRAKSHETYMLEESIPLIKPTPGTKVGEMNYIQWFNTAKILQGADLLEKDFEVRDVYDNRFI